MFTIYKYTSSENKVYIGCTKHDLKTRAGLLGSGYRSKCRFWDAILRLGWSNFIPEILATTDDAEDAARLELQYIEDYQATDPDFGYNTERIGYSQKSSDYNQKVSEGTKKGLASKETRARMSEAQYAKWADPEYRMRTTAAMKIACNTAEHRKRVSDAQKIAQNKPERKAQQSEIFSGLIFINNGVISKRVKSEEVTQLIATGEWKRGRLAKGPGSRGSVAALRDRIWVHKDSESRFVPKAEVQSYLDTGWLLGRGKLNRK